MARKRTSDELKRIEQNRQADKPEKKVPPDWNSGVLAFEWWEPAPDGFCSSPDRKHLRNTKP